MNKKIELPKCSRSISGNHCFKQKQEIVPFDVTRKRRWYDIFLLHSSLDGYDFRQVPVGYPICEYCGLVDDRP